MRRLALGAALALLAAPALGQAVPVQTGQWVQVFAPDVERALGRSVRIDVASIVGGGLGRSFREAEVLLVANRHYPRGATILTQRSVDCARGRVVTSGWQVLGPTGLALGAGTGGQVRKVAWDGEDGKVLKMVCQGIRPR